jgi:tRNA (guanine10-N2)-dimethyltransferase
MIFELNKDNLDIAKQEVLSLAHTDKHQLFGNILVCEADFDFTRLAYTRRVFEEIFVSDKIEDVNWEKYYKNNFCVRSNINAKEKELAAIIWDKVTNPKAKMRNSESEFWFFFIEKNIICGKIIWKKVEKFHLRRPDLRPGFFPVSVKPKLGRALINLSGVIKGKIWDPFCGTGGILLEAAIIGLEVEGTDIDPAMIRAAKKNFQHYKQKGEFSVADARKVIKKCDVIVTDPPYGRRASLHKVEVKNLYEGFLENVYDHIDTVVLVIPNDLQVKSKYKVFFEAEEYIHKSLTRRIIILTKNI